MTNRNNWKLGASSCILGSIDNFTFEGFSQYSKAGIGCCELSIWPQHMAPLDFIEHPEKLGKIINDAGVQIHSVHLPYTDGASLSSPDEEITKASLDIIKVAIRSAAKLGAKVVVIHPSAGHYDEWDTREELLSHSIKCVKKVCEYANSFNLKCAVENMVKAAICNTASEIVRYLKEIPSLGLCFDLNHSLINTNEEVFNRLIEEKMHGRIYHIHVSDYDFVNERHWLPGNGINDWEMILAKLEELNYDGAWMYEVAKTTASCLEVSQNYKKIVK